MEPLTQQAESMRLVLKSSAGCTVPREAEDLVQGTYVRSMQAMERLRPGQQHEGPAIYYPQKCVAQSVEKARDGPQMVDNVSLVACRET